MTERLTMSDELAKALRVPHPLKAGALYPASTVLSDLAGQEGCDGEPYDTMQRVADALRAALTAHEAQAKAPPSERETGWLIERKYPTNTIGATEPRWYAERVNGDHWWTPVPNDAKRFSSKNEAEAYPAYKMIAGDPTINITEHMWINDGFSWSHGQVSEERGVIICPDCRGERRGANGLLCSRCGGTAQIRRQSLRADEAAPFEADEISKAPPSDVDKTLAELDARYAAGDLDQIGSMWGFVRSHIASLVKERDDAQAEVARMREELRHQAEYARTRIGDGDVMGARVWRIALQDIANEIDAALNPETPANG